jgi:hypothetical protein
MKNKITVDIRLIHKIWIATIKQNGVIVSAFENPSIVEIKKKIKVYFPNAEIEYV